MIGKTPKKSMKYRLFFAAFALGVAILPLQEGSAQDFPYQVFERYLEPLAQQIGMPGMSALIVRNNRIEWHRGYGFSDVESRTPADIDTPYAIGGVTQAVTAVLIGVCADRFRFDIEQPIRAFVPSYPYNVSIRHVLAHATDTTYRYDPATYTALTTVVERCSQMPYRVSTAVEVLNRLRMGSSVPGLDLGRPEGAAAGLLFEPDTLRRYQTQLQRVATRTGFAMRSQSRSEYPSYGLDAAGGLVATARDLYEFRVRARSRRTAQPIDAQPDVEPGDCLRRQWQPHPDADRSRLVRAERVD